MSVTRVLEDDPELGERLSPEDRDDARQAGAAPVETLKPGVWAEPVE